jgi:hypothetical protein
MSTKLIGTASGLTMGLAALLSGATFAGFATAAVASEQTAAQGDTSRRVCRSITLSGSRLSRRVCRTQAEWDASRDRTQDGVLQHQVMEQTNTEQRMPR